METFLFGEHFQAIFRPKSSVMWRLWKWKNKNLCNACARHAREGVSLSTLFSLFFWLSLSYEKISHVLIVFSESFPKNSNVFQKISNVLRCNSVPFCHLMVLAIDRTTILNPIWLFLWHSHHEELCKITDLRYKNTNIPLLFYNFTTKSLVLCQQITKLHKKQRYQTNNQYLWH